MKRTITMTDVAEAIGGACGHKWVEHSLLTAKWSASDLVRQITEAEMAANSAGQATFADNWIWACAASNFWVQDCCVRYESASRYVAMWDSQGGWFAAKLSTGFAILSWTRTELRFACHDPAKFVVDYASKGVPQVIDRIAYYLMGDDCPSMDAVRSSLNTWRLMQEQSAASARIPSLFETEPALEEGNA